MPTAMQTAVALYQSAGRSIERDLGAFSLRGYIASGPERLLWFRPAVLANLERWPEPGEADTWLVHLAIGERALQWFVDQCPYYLPNVAWYRRFKFPDSPPRIYRTDSLVRHSRRK